MRPIEMEMSVVIDASPESVWPFLVDWENLNRWMLEGSGFTVTSPHREGLGVEAEAKIRIGGISTIDRVRVTGWNPPNFLEISHLGWVKGKGIMHAEAPDSRTTIHWKEIFIPPWGILGAVGMRGLAPLMKRIFKRDLGILKTLVEAEQPG
jgi:carbon monoxide dehydrogenase subunit G